MLSATPARSAPLSFDETLERLQAHRDVFGLLAIGSTAVSLRAAGSFGEASDIDLAVLVDGAAPAPSLALTRIDGRLADVLFVTTEQLEAWPQSAGSRAWEPARLARWLRDGRILYDRAGSLADAQARAQRAFIDERLGADPRYAVWFSLNYNLAQTLRMADAADPVYALAVELRLLYSLSDLWRAYFDLRDLPQRGEKEQIRYLTATDPSFLNLFQQTLSARPAGSPEQTARLQAYAELVRRCLAPVGDVWANNEGCWLPWLPVAGETVDRMAMEAWWQSLFGA